MKLGDIFDDQGKALRNKIVWLLTLLLAANVIAWGFAFYSFHAIPVLLGTSTLAWTFGLRHAVDADHIAAIDNVTRKLMQDGRRPVSVGFFFSLGHSTIVVLASVAVAATATAVNSQAGELRAIGGIIGPFVSAGFLLLIALINILVLHKTFQAFRKVRAGTCVPEDTLDAFLSGGGYLTAILRPAFRLVTRSWHMYPLGFLFGLGFDTATEVGLLGFSAAQASHGMNIWAIMIFPLLFTAGMSLIDTIDSILMLGVYGWAYVKPLRKLYYNMTITSISVIVALLVGGIEALSLLSDQDSRSVTFWGYIGALNENLGNIGFLIVGIFLAAWMISSAIYRTRGCDDVDYKTE